MPDPTPMISNLSPMRQKQPFEPWRLFFALAMVNAVAGVLPWFLVGLGAGVQARPIYHAMTQVQSLLGCVIAGFLYTFIPKRTSTPFPGKVTLGLTTVGLMAVPVATWFEQWTVAQVLWGVGMAAMFVFAVSRMRAKAVPLPTHFIWIPVTLALCFLGIVLTAVGSAVGGGWWWLHDTGRAMVLEGFVTGAICGIAPFLLPVLFGAPPPAQQASREVQAALAVIFFTSFFVDYAPVFTRGVFGVSGLQLGYAMKAAITAVVLLPTAVMKVNQKGVHRVFARTALLFLPLGFALVAFFPGYRKAMLHVVFLGGYALIAYSVSLHIAMAHSGRLFKLDKLGWPVVSMAALLFVALVARVLLDLNVAHYRLWLTTASGAFLLATLSWTAIVLELPALLRRKAGGRAATGDEAEAV